MPGSPRIVVRGFAVMGGIEVKSRPNRSGPCARPWRQQTRLGHGFPGTSVAPPPRGRRTVRRRHRRHDRRHGDDPVLRHGRLCGHDRTSRATKRRDGCSTSTTAWSARPWRERRPRGQRPRGRLHGRVRRRRPRPALCHRHPARGPSYVPEEGGAPLPFISGSTPATPSSEGDDYLGHTVIVASRLADVAGPGEILVSSLSEQLVQGSGEFSFDGHRETRLKGLARASSRRRSSWGVIGWTRAPGTRVHGKRQGSIPRRARRR